MARLHFVKKARKSYKSAGIKKGQSYYWWQFWKRPRIRSLTRPRPSQLVASAYVSEVLSLQEQVTYFTLDDQSDPESIAGMLDEIAERFEELAGEQSEKRDNMPDHLQDSPTGELLQERETACEETAESVREAADALRSLDEEADPDEIRTILDNISWSE